MSIFTWAEITVPTSGGSDVQAWAWDSGHSLLVGVGGNGLVYTTPDLVTVTKRTAAAANRWNGVAYAPTLGTAGRLAAVGSSAGSIMTSDDGGVTWTSRTMPVGGATAWRDVVWAAALGLFVAVGDNSATTSQVMTSPDGITWTLQTAALNAGWLGIAWSSSLGLLVAVCSNTTPPAGGFVMTSTNGTVWTQRATPANAYPAGAVSTHPNSVIWDAVSGLFAVMSRRTTDSLRRVTTSPDGVNWTEQTIPNSSDVNGGLIGFPGVGLVLFRQNTGNDNVNTSANGSTWATETTGVNRFLYPAGKIESLNKIVAWAGANTVMLVGSIPPTVTRVVPSLGRTLGGKLVQIHGTNFTGTPTVTFDGVAAMNVVRLSSTRIRARTPAHAAGIVDVSVNGVTLTDAYTYTDSMFGDLTIRQEQGIHIDKELNDAPDQCEFTSDGCASLGVGKPVQVIDPASGATLFGGTALITTDAIDGTPAQVGRQGISAGDLTWRLNALRPIGKWVDWSASDIYQNLIDLFAPQFTGFIEAGLPVVSLTCDRSQTLSEAFSALAALAQCSWRPDDDFGIHVFTSGGSPAPGVPPDPITDDTPLYDPPPTVVNDITQVRNRVYVKGMGGDDDAAQVPIDSHAISNMVPTPAVGGSIPSGFYEYSMTSLTADGESVPESFGYGGVLDLTGANHSFDLTNLDATVVPDLRVIGRNLYRSRSTEDNSVPLTTNCVKRQYLVTTLGNTAGIGEDTFSDGLADAALIQLAPNVDSTATIFVMVEDTVAQAYLASLLNVDGGSDDGAREGYIHDPSLRTVAQATDRANAELALFAYPIQTVTYACRDEKSVPGEDVSINLTRPPVVGVLKIQSVRIDQIQVDALGELFPRFFVTASSVRFTLDDLLRRASLGGGAT